MAFNLSRSKWNLQWLCIRIGGAILDIDNPSIVKYRCENFLITPEEWYEERGFVPNVTFPCATIHDSKNNKMAIYYGAATAILDLLCLCG